jgi:hypothetical protein
LHRFNEASKGWIVKTATLDVRAPSQSMADFARAWKTGQSTTIVRISFASSELLWTDLQATHARVVVSDSSLESS